MILNETLNNHSMGLFNENLMIIKESLKNHQK
jgi:hypothetical protein